MTDIPPIDGFGVYGIGEGVMLTLCAGATNVAHIPVPRERVLWLIGALAAGLREPTRQISTKADMGAARWEPPGGRQR